jgi:bacterioferritin
MKGSAVVIKELNNVLVDLLSTINQTFLHARIFQNWGLENLNSKVYKASIREMKSADTLIERILFLEGLPNLQDLRKLWIGETTEEILSADMKRFIENIENIKKAIVVSEKENDFQTRDLLEKFLHEEEELVDWIETQQHLIKTMGLENYIAEQTKGE